MKVELRASVLVSVPGLESEVEALLAIALVSHSLYVLYYMSTKGRKLPGGLEGGNVGHTQHTEEPNTMKTLTVRGVLI